MNLESLRAALHKAPFVPFELHGDGRVFLVEHSEQVLITADKQTVVLSTRDAHLHLIDVARISSITFKRRARAA